MNIIKAFEAAFYRAKENNWDYIVVLVDIHDTIFKATYSKEENYEYIGKAKDALQVMSARKDIKIILWSSTFSKVQYILKLDKVWDIFYSPMLLCYGCHDRHLVSSSRSNLSYL